MDEQTLIGALHEHPDDDAARLVYADWLEEHGETVRAQLLRVQLERKKVSAADPRARALDQREKALLVQCEVGWALSGALREKVRLHWHLGLVAAFLEERAKLTDADLAQLA